VLQPNGREHSHLRRQDVRGVETTAKAHFYHGDVHVLARKIEEAQGGGELEEGAEPDVGMLPGGADVVL
jgi:hypothetical protein